MLEKALHLQNPKYDRSLNTGISLLTNASGVYFSGSFDEVHREQAILQLLESSLLRYLRLSQFDFISSDCMLAFPPRYQCLIYGNIKDSR